MGTSDLPDMYAQSPRAYISGKSSSAHVKILCNTSKADSLVASTIAIAASFIYPSLEDSIMVRQQ